MGCFASVVYFKGTHWTLLGLFRANLESHMEMERVCVELQTGQGTHDVTPLPTKPALHAHCVVSVVAPIRQPCVFCALAWHALQAEQPKPFQKKPSMHEQNDESWPTVPFLQNEPRRIIFLKGHFVLHASHCIELGL
jgi:hypothetical protein